MDQVLIKDIGRKCSDDVADAIRRNMALVDGARAKMVITTYAAASAIGSANGAFSAFVGGPDEIDADMVDRLWGEILRPMILDGIQKLADREYEQRRRDRVRECLEARRGL